MLLLVLALGRVEVGGVDDHRLDILRREVHLLCLHDQGIFLAASLALGSCWTLAGLLCIGEGLLMHRVLLLNLGRIRGDSRADPLLAFRAASAVVSLGLHQKAIGSHTTVRETLGVSLCWNHVLSNVWQKVALAVTSKCHGSIQFHVVLPTLELARTDWVLALRNLVCAVSELGHVRFQPIDHAQASDVVAHYNLIFVRVRAPS